MENERHEGAVIYQLTRKDLEDVIEKVVRKVSREMMQERRKDAELYTLTRDETAKILKVSLTTLYNLEKRGDLVPKRIGAKVVYRRSDIDEYFKLQQV